MRFGRSFGRVFVLSHPTPLLPPILLPPSAPPPYSPTPNKAPSPGPPHRCPHQRSLDFWKEQRHINRAYCPIKGRKGCSEDGRRPARTLFLCRDMISCVSVTTVRRTIAVVPISGSCFGPLVRWRELCGFLRRGPKRWRKYNMLIFLGTQTFFQPIPHAGSTIGIKGSSSKIYLYHHTFISLSIRVSLCAIMLII